MPIITKQVEKEPVTNKIQTKSKLFEEIKEYMEYAELGEDFNSFFNGAAEYALKKDTKFKNWKKDQKAPATQSAPPKEQEPITA